MSAAVRPVLAPIGWSVALHAAIAGLLLAGLVLPESEPLPDVMQIEAVIVNQAVIDAAASLRHEDERRQEREAAQQRKEQERLEQIEGDRRLEEERQLEAERAGQQKAEAEARRKSEEDAKQKAEQQSRARAAAELKRKAEEARLKAERESDLRARLAEEEQRTSGAFQSQKAQYVAAIQDHVERRWFRPPGTPAGATCVAFVTQIPGGEVVGVRFGDCGGGEALRRSIENAIRNASPLPAPLQPGLFDREVRLVFRSGE